MTYIESKQVFVNVHNPSSQAYGQASIVSKSLIPIALLMKSEFVNPNNSFNQNQEH